MFVGHQRCLQQTCCAACKLYQTNVLYSNLSGAKLHCTNMLCNLFVDGKNRAPHLVVSLFWDAAKFVVRRVRRCHGNDCVEQYIRRWHNCCTACPRWLSVYNMLVQWSLTIKRITAIIIIIINDNVYSAVCTRSTARALNRLGTVHIGISCTERGRDPFGRISIISPSPDAYRCGTILVNIMCNVYRRMPYDMI